MADKRYLTTGEAEQLVRDAAYYQTHKDDPDEWAEDDTDPDDDDDG